MKAILYAWSQRKYENVINRFAVIFFQYFLSAYDYTIPPMEKTLVKTDIQIALPSGCYGRVGESFKKQVTICQVLLCDNVLHVSFGVISRQYCLGCV